MLEQVEDVIDAVSNKLPKDFPEAIANSIFNGMRDAKSRFLVKG
jgi:hypothetical protein